MAKSNLPQTQIYIDKYTRWNQLYLRANKTPAEVLELENLKTDLVNYLVTAEDFNDVFDRLATLTGVVDTHIGNSNIHVTSAQKALYDSVVSRFSAMCQGISNTDVNTLVLTGRYIGENLTNSPNKALGQWYFVDVIAGSGWIKQIFYDYFSNKIFIRSMMNNVWNGYFVIPITDGTIQNGLYADKALSTGWRDSRNDGLKTPQWYVDNGRNGGFLELNTGSNVGCSDWGNVHVVTTMPWNDTSGGVRQIIYNTQYPQLIRTRIANSSTVWSTVYQMAIFSSGTSNPSNLQIGEIYLQYE